MRMNLTAKKSRIQSILIDANLDERVKEFENSLGDYDRITNSVVAGKFLVITVEINNSQTTPKNLLLEEARGNQT